MMKEIKGFPGYFVTENGDVYSSDYSHTGKMKKLRPIKKTTGYYSVWLCKNGCRINKLLHRIVAETFIPNPENKKTVNHKNGIKSDNRMCNLEWNSYSENLLHAFKTGLRKPPLSMLGKFGKNNPKSKIVIQIKNGKIVAEFYGLSEAGRKTNISVSNICKCCKGKNKSAGGYQWKYKGC